MGSATPGAGHHKVDVPFSRVSVVRALRWCGAVVLAEKVRGGRCVTMGRGGWSGEVLWVLCGERGRQDEAPCCDGDWSGIGPDLVLFLDGRVLCGMIETPAPHNDVWVVEQSSLQVSG